MFNIIKHKITHSYFHEAQFLSYFSNIIFIIILCLRLRSIQNVPIRDYYSLDR
jgi:hypothetical protein